MTASTLVRPADTEYAPFYAAYIARVPEGDIVSLLADRMESTSAFLAQLSEAQGRQPPVHLRHRQSSGTRGVHQRRGARGGCNRDGGRVAQRLISPHAIRFNAAIAVGVVGLIVNVVSAFMLQDRHSHDHAGVHGKGHGHDHNLRAAYLHVLADALTSVLAIIALIAGKTFGWVCMDPFMGIVGAAIITKWAYGLLLDTGRILLDRDVDPGFVSEIVQRIEAESDNRVSDIHVWRVGSGSLSIILSDLSINKLPQDRRMFRLRTGERGMVTVLRSIVGLFQSVHPATD